ncbi:hypothetical protein RE432_13150 [Pusillimonas sp. SM2304]|nr:hypothetical protein [Pusillimonas sp. SM2304]MDS1141380.1 hypothetical protein [Pusillimonas sp. SM2304]
MSEDLKTHSMITIMRFCGKSGPDRPGLRKNVESAMMFFICSQGGTNKTP